MNPDLHDVIVIGGGQAGLAASYHLKRARLQFITLEASAHTGGSWPRYYGSLKLFSPARYSSLPGLPFPGDPDRYPGRDEVSEYLRLYADHFDLPVLTTTPVEKVISEGSQFVLKTRSGALFRARAVIAATGSFRDPFVPDIPGRAPFKGQVLHSADYHSPEAFAGRRIIVVGGGNSGVQIAVELARVGHVSLAVRKPVWFVPQRILGCDLHCWLKWTGLDRLNLFADQGTPFVVDAGGYRRAVAGGRPQERPMFLRFTESGVVWADGTAESVDSVIFATGFRPRLPYLADLGALDASSQVLHHGGISTVVPGLYFVGLSGQRTFASATLRGVGPDAARVVRHLRHHLRSEVCCV